MTANPQLTAGTAECNITPPVGAPLLGTIQRSSGVHDDLFARALVLSDGRQKAAVLCFDLIGMDFKLADEIRAAIIKKTGISFICLNCSHTHSSPFTIPWSVLGPRWVSSHGRTWRAELPFRTADLVAQADYSSEPVVLRSGRAAVQVGSNRRFPTEEGIVMKPNPAGALVPWVDVLSVDGLDGNPLAILFGHGAHPVIIHGASRLMSADFPGAATRKLKTHFGGKALPMFAQACGANVNADPLRGGFDASEEAGAALADAVVTAISLSNPVAPRHFDLKHTHTELPLQQLPTRKECEASLDQARTRVTSTCGKTWLEDDQLWDLQDQLGAAESQAKSAKKDDVQPMEGQPWWLVDNLLCLTDLMQKIESTEDQNLRFEAQLLRIGDDWSLLSATHELFAEYQLWFDQNAPTKHSMMLAYTNACESYIPTDRDFALGGYEAASFPSLAGAAFKYRHRRALRPGTEQMVIEQIRSLWK
jgi:neutral ceramidase